MSLKRFAKKIVQHIRQSAPGAKLRQISEAEVVNALKAHNAAVRKHKGLSVKTRLVGGYVPNSYGYAAQADRFEIFTDTKGATTYMALRGHAESKPCGRGPLLRIWTLTANGGMRRV